MRHYWPYLLQVLQKYAARGLRVTKILGDFEFNGIKGLVALLPTPTILDLLAENEHIGGIERNIRYAKEKVRSMRLGLCYSQIPGIVIVYMVLEASKMLNLFPRSGGVPHYSPNVNETVSSSFWNLCTSQRV